MALEEEDLALECVGPKIPHHYLHVHRQQQLFLRIKFRFSRVYEGKFAKKIVINMLPPLISNVYVFKGITCEAIIVINQTTTMS